MISDLLYAAASYKGITMVLDFIYRYEFFLQILGSLVVLAFGIHMYFSLPSYDVVDDGKSKNAWKLMTSAFFFALGNPLIAFVYMAFYSRYNFVPDTPTLGWHFVVAMLSIALGAITWWCVITYLVLRLKENVSVGGLRIFNKILALVFIGISLVGLAMCLIKFT
jgi:putative membrane protein